MPRLPRVTARQMVQALARGSWYVERETGGHVQMRHDERAQTVTVPMHAGRTLDPRLVQSILNQAGITADQLRQLL
jgi:predicted RNA binding protein YcfA (HicA-like mRNA interferase family)